MPPDHRGSILVLNGGSSSLKFALYSVESKERRLSSGKIERIGNGEARLSIADGETSQCQRTPKATAVLLDHPSRAARWPTSPRRASRRSRRLALCRAGAGHDAMLEELRRLAELDPDHLPGEIAIIEAVRRHRPGLPQIACFDTAFHAPMPRLARLIPIPRRFYEAGIRRYGFHGLSYEFLLEELARLAGPEAARGRVVLAHLGAGASLAATRDGRCVDTTMGFTPTSGMAMATRCGDLDPGVIFHLMRGEGMSADQVDDLLNHRSGLLGISETSADMRDLIAARDRDPRAADAVAFFATRRRSGSAPSPQPSAGRHASSPAASAKPRSGASGDVRRPEHLGVRPDETQR
jgi:acetate kinase